jgi:hypothetical protein
MAFPHGVPCTPGHHVGEAVAIQNVAPDEQLTHVCLGCGQLYDPASMAMWQELERGTTGSGGPVASGS